MSKIINSSEFEELKEVINSLTNSEKKYFERRLSLRIDGSTFGKSIKLFRAITNNPNLTLSEYLSNTNYEINRASFKKLLSRIMDRIIELFLLDESIRSNYLYDRRAVDIFSLEKQLLIAEIMRYRGLFDLAEKKLNKVITLCKDYEHYDILLYSIDKRKRWGIGIISEEELKELENEYVYYQKCKMAVKLAHSVYSRIIKSSNGPKRIIDLKYLNLSITQLKSISKKLNSKHLNYYLFYIIIEKNSLLGRYNECLKKINELIEFIASNVCVYSKLKYGNAILNKGIFYRFNFMYDLSILSFHESKKYISDSVQNNHVIYEQLIVSYLYSGNLSKAKYYLSLVKIDSKYMNINSMLLFIYYGLILNFINGEFRKNLQIFIQLPKSYKSFNLNFEIRVIEILNLIELEKFDLADTYIEKLRKYVSRCKGILSPGRVNLITRLLVSLSKASYHFFVVNKSYKKVQFDLIESHKKFKFNEYQMIPFHEWFEAKLKNVPYNHIEAMKRLKRLNTAKR